MTLQSLNNSKSEEYLKEAETYHKKGLSLNFYTNRNKNTKLLPQRIFIF